MHTRWKPVLRTRDMRLLRNGTESGCRNCLPFFMIGRRQRLSPKNGNRLGAHFAHWTSVNPSESRAAVSRECTTSKIADNPSMIAGYAHRRKHIARFSLQVSQDFRVANGILFPAGGQNLRGQRNQRGLCASTFLGSRIQTLLASVIGSERQKPARRRIANESADAQTRRIPRNHERHFGSGTKCTAPSTQLF